VCVCVCVHSLVHVSGGPTYKYKLMQYHLVDVKPYALPI